MHFTFHLWEQHKTHKYWKGSGEKFAAMYSGRVNRNSTSLLGFTKFFYLVKIQLWNISAGFLQGYAFYKEDFKSKFLDHQV